MLMLGDSDRAKKIATIIVDSRGKGAKTASDSPSMAYGSDDKQSEETDYESAIKATAMGIMSAIEAKDSGMLADALKTFIKQCEMKEDTEEDYS